MSISTVPDSCAGFNPHVGDSQKLPAQLLAAQQGDEEARSEVLRLMEPWARREARIYLRTSGSRLSFEDAVHEVRIAVDQAIMRWDEKRGASFQHLAGKLAGYRLRDAAVADVYNPLGCATRTQMRRRAAGSDYRFSSLDVIETRSCQQSSESVERLENVHLARSLVRQLAEVHPRQAEVIVLYYGLVDGVQLTDSEVAERLGITTMSAKKLRQRGTKTLAALAADHVP